MWVDYHFHLDPWIHSSGVFFFFYFFFFFFLRPSATRFTGIEPEGKSGTFSSGSGVACHGVFAANTAVRSGLRVGPGTSLAP